METISKEMIVLLSSISGALISGIILLINNYIQIRNLKKITIIKAISDCAMLEYNKHIEIALEKDMDANIKPLTEYISYYNQVFGSELTMGKNKPQ